MPTRLTADDFFSGLFAGLALEGKRNLSIRVDHFDPAIKRVFDRLQTDAAQYDVTPRFRIRPHRVHHDSLIVKNALSSAAQRDIIGFENPEYQDVRIKLSDADAERLLSGLPGGAELYRQLANEFSQLYAAPAVRVER